MTATGRQRSGQEAVQSYINTDFELLGGVEVGSKKYTLFPEGQILEEGIFGFPQILDRVLGKKSLKCGQILGGGVGWPFRLIDPREVNKIFQCWIPYVYVLSQCLKIILTFSHCRVNP